MRTINTVRRVVLSPQARFFNFRSPAFAPSSSFSSSSTTASRRMSTTTTTTTTTTATTTAVATGAGIGEATAPAVQSFKTIRRLDYRAPLYTIKTVDFQFHLKLDDTSLTSTLSVCRTEAALREGESNPPPLVFDRGTAAQQEVLSISVNGTELTAGTDYIITEKDVTILSPPFEVSTPSKLFTVTMDLHMKPNMNTALDGLYESDKNLITQCEAAGMRNITPFLDRPDVLAVFTTTLIGDKDEFPVLLSNGNLIKAGAVDASVNMKKKDNNTADTKNLHMAVWHDPFPKPCYLFALVAGNLVATRDVYKTTSGREVALGIYTVPKEAVKVSWAMESLKKAMKWDEDTFGLEYDLDILNVVATSFFSMGAMENKGLLVFNSRLILASPETASDVDFGRIEGVMAHEYFHNWTGNRVTCRDWFQLTLKEGLTVYRDQEFSSDMNSRPVKRIEDVSRMRNAQFGEDAGPTSHPVRPNEVVDYNNLYTATVYEKGAEVVRLYQTMFGKQGFRKGMDLYFKRHDGQAVTCEDFYQAMADANSDMEAAADIPALKNWYGQAGTPEVTITPVYDASAKTLTLKCKQRIPGTPGQLESEKVAVLIPIATALFGPDGAAVPLQFQGGNSSGSGSGGGAAATAVTSTVLRMTRFEQEWTFENVPAGVVPSLLRGFSAPVRINVVGRTTADLAFLLANDTDPFNRWEAGQELGRNTLFALYDAGLKAAIDASHVTAPFPVLSATVENALNAAGGVPASLSSAFSAVLAKQESLDGAFVARAISLPAETEIIDALAASSTHGNFADPVIIHIVREYVVKSLASSLRAQLEGVVKSMDAAILAAEAANGGKFSPAFEAVARRSLRNKALMYLSTLGDASIIADIASRHASATNMTDSVNTLSALVDQPAATTPSRQQALDAFYDKWKEENLVILKWIALQASASLPENTDVVKNLSTHPAFIASNPNMCYSLYLTYASSSVPAFHAADGSGYRFLAEAVAETDKLVPQVAARLVTPLSKLKSYDANRQSLMRKALEGLAAHKLSDNVGEIVTRALAV